VLVAEIQKGDHVLVHAGASGVGIAAIQLARFLGAYVSSPVSPACRIMQYDDNMIYAGGQLLLQRRLKKSLIGCCQFHPGQRMLLTTRQRTSQT